MVGRVRTCARFVRHLPVFLRATLTLDEAHAIVRRRLAEREEQFLTIVQRGIFGNPGSPYLALFRAAQCGHRDLERMVRTRGLEPTLSALRDGGVYISFDEFKGLRPIVRGGRTLDVQPSDFDNPHLGAVYHGETSGSSGAGARVMIDLEHVAAVAAQWHLGREAHGLVGVPTGLWRSILPGVSGVNNLLRDVRVGCVPLRWFAPVGPGALRPSLTARAATAYIVYAGRACGVQIPYPEVVSTAQAQVIARWAARVRDERGSCLIRTFVSLALRVSLAAQAEHLDLAGVTFMGGGEPPTAAKVNGIRASGARWIPTYAFAEAGPIGVGCARPADGNDLHLHEDALAVVQHPRPIAQTGQTVDAFYFTTLLPTAPKILLNVESDDYGVIERRRCGCPLDEVFPRHVRYIQSVSKLTTESMTLPGSEVVRLVEEVLPVRFGGTAVDYQLAEEEHESGLTRLVLRVDPCIQGADPHLVQQAIFAELRRGAPSADLARAMWAAADTLVVRREAPVWTTSGKLLPIRRAVERPRVESTR